MVQICSVLKGIKISMKEVYRRIYQERKIRGLSLDIDNNTENRIELVACSAGNFISPYF
jgi:hypothetical protein